ncbi:hypothetical protein PV728_48245, partial [Streptomyces europaeiscabiei]
MGALAGEDECGVAEGAAGAAYDAGLGVRVGVGVGECAQACYEFGAVVSGDGGAVFEHGSCAGEHACCGVGRQVRVAFQEVSDAFGLGSQCALTAPRQQHRQHRV